MGTLLPGNNPPTFGDLENENETVQGSPAFNIGEYKRSYVLFRNLPKLNNSINDLVKKVEKK
jgi:UDP-3-O-[3-hydroxymyristoyl] glucosamine N-acyltransferase